MHRVASSIFLLPRFLPLILAGCNQGYSPNTYAPTAAQEEAAVQRGIIIGVRQVMISADGAIGAAAGGAAGGVAGAQVSGSPVTTALGVIGGTLVGGIGGTAAAQAVADTKGWEYIVQEEPGDKLVSVTQTSKTALPIGLHVLVIADAQQARIVPDYTVQIAAAAPASAAPKTANPSNGSAALEFSINPVLPADGASEPLQLIPGTLASDPPTPAASSQPSPSSVTTAPAPSSTSGQSAGTFSGGSTPAQASPSAPIATSPSGSSSAVTP